MMMQVNVSVDHQNIKPQTGHFAQEINIVIVFVEACINRYQIIYQSGLTPNLLECGPVISPGIQIIYHSDYAVVASGL